MAEECKYYYYDSGYSCALKHAKESDSSVDSDTVYRYCWGYQYEHCPLYKAEHASSGGCYLTSACVEAKGLPDDCHELTTLRAFRDSYMCNLPSGKTDICEYYHTAPKIVAKIKELPNALETFDAIYNELVLPCVKMIEMGKLYEAYSMYKNYTRMFQVQYL